MKILHITEYENSGAGRAGMRLHLGLLNQNIDTTALVLGKDSDISSIVTPDKQIKLYKFLQAKLSDAVLKKFLGDDKTFSVNTTPSLLLKQIQRLNPEIINFHWIGRELIKIEELKSFKLPLVWTLHDMWGFTGGCHYNEDCDRYTNSCGACPQLNSTKESDITRLVWKRKAKAWKNLNLTIVAPSVWMADCAKASSLFKDLRIEVIPYGIDTQKFKPFAQHIARELLNLPQDKQLILFGAFSATEQKRKGFHFLLPALTSLSQAGWCDRIELAVFGASQPKKPIDLGFKTHYLGRLRDDLLISLLYTAADVFVAPSTQDNLPNTVMEALACGTPCVTFKIGGMPDMIDHQQNGYLAQPFDVEDLAKGIAWVLEDKERHQKMRAYAREKTEKEFPLFLQAQRYMSLYQELLQR